MKRITEAIRAHRLRVYTKKFGETEAKDLVSMSQQERIKRLAKLDRYEAHTPQGRVDLAMVEIREAATKAITSKNRLQQMVADLEYRVVESEALLSSMVLSEEHREELRQDAVRYVVSLADVRAKFNLASEKVEAMRLESMRLDEEILRRIPPAEVESEKDE